MDTSALARGILLLGFILVALGAFLTLTPKVPWIGRLPGDISFQAGNVRIFAPIVSCLLFSLLITIILNIAASRNK